MLALERIIFIIERYVTLSLSFKVIILMHMTLNPHSNALVLYNFI